MGISESEKMVVDGPIIGIDLGYSYSRVAVWHNNRVVIIPNDLGELHTPSCVAFTDNGLLVGETAKNQIGSNPENTIFGMKRLIGRRFEEFEEDKDAPRFIKEEIREMMQRCIKRFPFKVAKGRQGDIKIAENHRGMKRLIGRRFEEFKFFKEDEFEEFKEDEDEYIIKEQRKVMQRYIKRLPFKVVKGQQGDIKIAVNHQGEEKTYAVQQILSLLLRKMKDDAQEFLGIEVENAVITVPGMFNNLQRRATIDAGRIAGLNVVRILNESTAAALAYVHQEQHKSTEEKYVHIYDFGGSKVDSSVVKINGPHLSVDFSIGDIWFGGDDLDDHMVHHLAKEFKQQSNVDITKGNPEQLWRLRKHWEKAKRSLSTTNLVTLEIDSLHGNIDFNIKISNDMFEELSQNFLDSFKDHIPMIHDDLVLVGGLNHIPMIRETTKRCVWEYPKELRQLVNPNEAVAIGAAIQGAMISGVQPMDIRYLRVRDITRYALFTTRYAQFTYYRGKRNLEGVVAPFSPFPICVATSCRTTSQHQKNMTFGIYECFGFHNLFLGDIVVEGITPVSAGHAEVELMFNIDENCILTDVTAKESHSGRELSVAITNDPSRLSNEEIEKMMVELETWRSYDNILKDMDFAKNKLEAGLMGMTNKLEDERLKEKMEPLMYRELEVFASKLKAWIWEEGNDASYQILRQKKIELKNMQHKMSPFVAPEKVEDDASGSVEVPYEPVIGVDLGTSNSCVALWENGDAKIVLSEQGNRFIPSYIAFSDDDDEVLYGEVAKAHLTYNPQNTIYGIKRLIGRKFNDEMVQDEIKMWTFEVAKGEDNEPMIIVKYKEEMKHYSAPEIMSILLENMKGLAEKMLSKFQIKDAVVTVPIHFGQSERTTITNVAAMVGLEIYQIISEPTAAAMAYLSNNISDEKKKVIVFDLGGGTLDVSLLEMQKSTVQVKAMAGNSHLGGEDFDKSLIKHLIDIFNKKNHVDISKNKKFKKSIGKLKVACEMAKWRLCAKNGHSTKVEIEALSDGKDLCETVQRTTFEEINQVLFERCIEPIEQCLKEAKLKAEEVDEVVLVGGSTRIPKIRELLKKFFKGKELFDSLPPEEVVASGAALIGARSSQGEKDDFIVEFHLGDVTSVSLGFRMNDGIMNFVIPRSTKIPTKKEIIFDTHYPVILDVYEGEKEIAKENHFLGKLKLSDITSSSTGDCKLKVSFIVDKNNKVQVTATDIMAGNTTTYTFSENTGRLNKDEIAEIIRQNEKIRFEKKKSKRKWKAWNKFKEVIDSHSAQLSDENVKSVIGEYVHDILSMANSKAIEWLNKEGLEADLKDIERIQKDQDWLFTALIKKPDLQPDEVLPSSLAILGAKIDSDQKGDSRTKGRLSLATLGFRRNDGSMKVVIPRNTETPIKKVITLYQTQYPITLDVYEGEKEMANENHLLGTLILVCPKPTSTGDCLLEVTFIVDKNNGVQVIARDTKSDIIVAKTFSNNDCRLNMNAISMMIQENENMSFEQKKTRKKREALSDIEAYVNLLTYALKDLKARIRLGRQIYDVVQKANESVIKWLKSAGLEAELNDLIKMKEDHGLIIKALRKRISL